MTIGVVVFGMLRTLLEAALGFQRLQANSV